MIITERSLRNLIRQEINSAYNLRALRENYQNEVSPDQIESVALSMTPTQAEDTLLDLGIDFDKMLRDNPDLNQIVNIAASEMLSSYNSLNEADWYSLPNDYRSSTLPSAIWMGTIFDSVISLLADNQSALSHKLGIDNPTGVILGATAVLLASLAFDKYLDMKSKGT